ncbi:MAG: tRNA dimethylallyltransferase [Chloroflexota bacterium]
MRTAPLVVIAGATATGKTGTSIALATYLRDAGRAVEIVSADSRQVFRGLDIGTAKLPVVERRGIVHHGLDLVDPGDRFTVGDFARHARPILERLGTIDGAVAILVGGTGLYLRSIVAGLDLAGLPEDPAVRATLEEDLARHGREALAARLVATAPRLAASTDLRNPRRVVRALELAQLGGDRERPAPTGYPGPHLRLGLVVPEARLHAERISARARAQFDAGLVDEARALRERYDPGLPAFSAIGYREAWAFLDGAIDREAAIQLDAHRNVAFARRQRTWFRSELGYEWLDATDDPAGAVIGRVDRFLAALPVS